MLVLSQPSLHHASRLTTLPTYLTHCRSASASAGAHPTSSWLTEDNAERLAAALCRMRGAALKLGQMLSIQDENVLPPQVGQRPGLGCLLLPLLLVMRLHVLQGSSSHSCSTLATLASSPFLQFQAALERVRAGADVMPRRQLEKVSAGDKGVATSCAHKLAPVDGS